MITCANPKLLSLVVLVLQNTFLVLLMRVAVTSDGPRFLPSAVVVADESTKLLFCLVMLAIAYVRDCHPGGDVKYSEVTAETADVELGTRATVSSGTGDVTEANPSDGPSFRGYLQFLKSTAFISAFDLFKMSFPAAMYALQKNLLFLAVSNLDAATFQVAYQGKILTTAVFSVLFLKTRLSKQQIVGLVVLMIGVCIVQLSAMSAEHTQQKSHTDNVMVGSLAVLGACCTSGMAAIYFEWILKVADTAKSVKAESYNIWVRNLQLAIFALASASVGVAIKDAAAVRDNGLLHGFTPLVWSVVGLQAFGGIVVALVIKYADNILKNFATAVSIVASVIVSWLFLEFRVELGFVFGAVAVMAAVVMYSTSNK